MTSTKRRLASLASASALIATMAVAIAPTAALAAEGNVVVNGTTLKALYVNPEPETLPAVIDAQGYDIAVYFGPGHTGTVDADISGARWYGVVADGAMVDVTGSQIHHIGDNPYGTGLNVDGQAVAFSGMQYGVGIFYTNASGTISGNEVSLYQKGGIVARDGGKVTISGNMVAGLGKVGFIAQNGIQVSYGTTAVVSGNTVSGNYYTPKEWTATGLLIYQANGVKASNNSLFDNETNMYNGGKGGGNVKP